MKKILIAVMCIGVLAAVVGFGAYAQFTSSATATANFTDGTVVISASNTADYSADLANLKPGETVYFTAHVVNTGSLPCVLTAAMPVATWSFSGSAYLTTGLALWDGTNYVNWDGTGGPTLAAGGDTYVKISVTLDASTPNDYQGATGTLTCALTGTQTP
jgi:hypothetical protein